MNAAIRCVLVAWVLAQNARVIASQPANSTSVPDPLAVQAMAVLKKNCMSCHNEQKQKGGLVLATRESLLKGGDNGPVLEAGSDQESRLTQVVLPDSDPHMPPKKQLTDGEIATLRSWVTSGFPWDENALSRKPDLLPADRLGSLPASYQPALALAVSPDGKSLAAGRGSRVDLYDLSEAQPRLAKRIDGARDAVQSLAWSRDGQWLAAGEFRRVFLWRPDISDTAAAASEITNFVGRVTALAFSPDNESLIIADGTQPHGGWIRCWSMAKQEFDVAWAAHDDSILDLSLTPDGKILASGGTDKLIKLWELPSGKPISEIEGHTGHILALAFNTNGTLLATAGADKEIKIWDISTKDQKITIGGHSGPITGLRWTVDGQKLISTSEDGAVRMSNDTRNNPERTIAQSSELLTALALSPDGKMAYAAAFGGNVYGWEIGGKERFKLAPPEVVSSGASSPPELSAANPPAPATSRANNPVHSESTQPQRISFVSDILPVLSKAGCNAGKCHAKPEGQNGFKLSVFAYDPMSDYKEIINDTRGRRVFPSYPEESLILKKPAALIDHEGGQRFEPGSKSYDLIKRWIEAGMPFSQPDEPVLVSVQVSPAEGVYKKGAEQILTVEARYSNDIVRNVTDLAEFDSTDKDLARVDDQGRVYIGQNSGEAVVIARFMGMVATARITVPGDRRLLESLYQKLPVRNFIDELAYGKFQKLGLFPSELCTDAEFIRRVSLDLIGTLPSADQVRQFLVDGSPHKRARFVDSLLQHPAYADHWASKWADLIRPNPDRVGVKSVYTLDQWLRDSFRQNKPYDRFVREILTAQGSTHQNGPTVVFRDRREPADVTTLVSQVFLGVRLECAKCHHHPNEKWSQVDFYQFAAYFGEIKRKGTGISPPISGDYEVIYHAPGGHVKHPLSGAEMKPKPPDGPPAAIAGGADPRAALAEWVCNPSNPFFSRAIVNRVWAELMGRGIVDPADDFRTSNPPTNEPLLDALAGDFVKHGFDLKHLMRTIVTSHVYQLSSLPNEYNAADTRHFSRAYRRRLPAEVLMDAVADVTEISATFQGLAAGSRAKATWNYKIHSEFLDAFGRPNSSSDCPCERDSRTSVVQALHLMNSNDLQARIANPNGRAARLAASGRSISEIVNELYLSAFSRFPSPEELSLASRAFAGAEATRASATEDVMWALINSAEFVFNH